MNLNRCLLGDCRDGMRQLIAEGMKVQTCITSPPYYGLRDYGHDGQIGLEETPDQYIAAMVEVFSLVRALLADDGTLWLNIGDSYAGSWGSQGRQGHSDMASRSAVAARQIAASAKKANGTGRTPEGIKPKDLFGIPWMLAFALRADGWYLRQDIIWSKPNPMPESVRDRCTKAHEYLFLLSKSEKYFFDQEAISEPIAAASIDRLSQPNLANQQGSDRVPGKTNGTMKAVMRKSGNLGRKDRPGAPDGNTGAVSGSIPWEGSTRNKRSVWTVPTVPFKGAHFATFPPALIEPCILAGDIVFDPFLGSGTVAQVAQQLGRNWLGCELNPEYLKLQAERTVQPGLILEASA